MTMWYWPKKKKLAASEFEGSGPAASGVYGTATAEEKLRLIYRTEQDPDVAADIEAEPDKWKHGGIESIKDIKI
jgi:hypothetical protein